MLVFTEVRIFFNERNKNPFQPLLTETKIEFLHKQQSLSKPKNIKVLRTANHNVQGFRYNEHIVLNSPQPR